MLELLLCTDTKIVGNGNKKHRELKNLSIVSPFLQPQLLQHYLKNIREQDNLNSDLSRDQVITKFETGSIKMVD